MFAPTHGTLVVQVMDEDGSAVPGADVFFEVDGKTVKETESDAFGKASLENIKEGTYINVIVDKEDYLSEEEEFELYDIPEQSELIILTLESAGYTTKTIRLVDASGMSVAAAFTLNFSCPDNPYSTPPATINLSSSDRGVAIVNVPNDCGRLIATVKNTIDYQEIISKEIISDDFIIELSAITRDKGTLKVYVTDSEDSPLDGIKIILYQYNHLLDDPYAGPVDFSYTSNGYAELSWPAGNYVVRAYDSSGEHGDTEYEDEFGNNVIKIVADEETRINLQLTEEVIGQIKIKVFDKKSGDVVDAAEVR